MRPSTFQRWTTFPELTRSSQRESKWVKAGAEFTSLEIRPGNERFRGAALIKHLQVDGEFSHEISKPPWRCYDACEWGEEFAARLSGVKLNHKYGFVRMSS